MYYNLDTVSKEYVSPGFKELEDLIKYNRERIPNYDNDYGTTFKFKKWDCVIVYCRRKDD